MSNPDPDGIFDLENPKFDELAKVNGTRYWYARDLMKVLGYESWTAFVKVINKAIASCATVGAPVMENFIQTTSPSPDGKKESEDFKLSRYACCLITMNSDPRKPIVAAAQNYFVSIAIAVQDIKIDAESVDRVVIRSEISEREVTLMATAREHGLELFDRFHNAGYRGMYNMELRALKTFKGMPDLKRSLLDFMGKDELAANLFRLSLTEGRIKRDEAKGQHQLERIAFDVGSRVRDALIEETGTKPEDLAISSDIREVKRGLRDTQKGFAAHLDNLSEQRAHESAFLAIASSEIVPGCEECESGNPHSHFGSPQCSLGSVASGGTVTHCSCDYCQCVVH